MEKEKFELQKRHTENIQELLEDTNVRLNKMEGDYAAQMQSTVRLLPVWSLWAALFISLPSCIPASRAGRAWQGCCGVKTPRLPSRLRLTRGSVWPLPVAVGFPLGSVVVSFSLFLPLQTFIKLSSCFFFFFPPLTFSLEIVSLLFYFLFYLFVSAFLGRHGCFLEMCNAHGKTVRSGGGAVWL